MVIQRMNNVLVKHSKILFGFITAIIIVSFVWFFTPGVDGSLLFGGSSSPVYGKVFDKDVTYGDISDAMRDCKLITAGVNAIPPSYINSLSENDAFIVLAAPLKAAEQLNIRATDGEVVDFISRIAFFQNEDGSFSNEKYDAYASKYLKMSGATKADFENAVRGFITVVKLGLYDTRYFAGLFRISNQPQLIAYLEKMNHKNMTVTENELAAAIVTFLENYKARAVVFKVSDFIPRVTATPENARDFYDKNPGAFMTEPVSDSVAAVAEIPSFAPDAVTAEQLDKAFAGSKSQKRFEGKTEKEIRGILKKEIEENSSAMKAYNKINEFSVEMNKLQTSEEFKNDPGKTFADAAGKAGLKVETIKGFTVKSLDPEAVKNDPSVKKFKNDEELLRYTAFLKKPGEISSFIRVKDGFGLVLLTRRIDSRKLEYSEAVNQAENLFKRQSAFELASNAARELRVKLETIPDAGKALAETAKAAGAELENIPVFNLFQASLADGQRAGLLRVLAANTDTGKLSKELPFASEVVSVFVDERIAPTDEAVAKSKENLRMDLAAQKQRLEAQSFAEWISANVKILVRKDSGKNTGDGE